MVCNWVKGSNERSIDIFPDFAGTERKMAIHCQGKVILVVLFLPHKKNRDDARL